MKQQTVNKIHQDLKSLSPEDFQRKYGKTPEQVKSLNDADLAKIAGGMFGAYDESRQR